MTFSYEPLDEEQCEKERQFPMLEPGIYNFQVIEALYKLSKTNNHMIQLKLLVWSNEGKEFTIFDYLVSTPKMIWKTLHFCKAVGLEEEYTNKKFNEDSCLNKSGKVSIIYQIGAKKEDGTYYKDKNGVEDYICGEVNPNVATITKDDFFNDSVPF